MKKTYTKLKIGKYHKMNHALIVFAILFGVIIGKFFFYPDIRNILSGLVLGTFGATMLIMIEHNFRKKISFERGASLEDIVTNKLESAGYTCTQSIQTGNGDLDILAVKEDIHYGIEVKNLSGIISAPNGNLEHNGYPLKQSLHRLLANCKFVRNSRYGITSHIFVEPIMIFGYNAALKNIQNGGVFHGKTKIHVISVRDFDTFF